MHPLPEIVNNITSLYSELMEKHLPGLMEGFYIYGSSALDDFQAGKSDIDFITIVSRKLSYIDIEKLQMVHGLVKVKHRKPEMNGIYVMTEQLGKTKDEIEPVTYYYRSKIHDKGYFEINYVTWYQLKHKAVTVKGVPSAELDFAVDWNSVLKEMHGNLNTYWVNWLNKASGFSLNSLIILLFSRTTEWGVLGVTRQYYSFLENDIVSKTAAGKWALTKVPEEYHGIINKALSIRVGKKSKNLSVFKRKKDALSYIRYIIEESNKNIIQK